jgi:HAMP domain-containing protein
MNDIVALLRATGSYERELLDEAADEIERHRSAAKLQADQVERLTKDRLLAVEKMLDENDEILRLHNEVERLRAELQNAKTLAGAVTPGPSFADIKQNKNVIILDGSRGE